MMAFVFITVSVFLNKLGPWLVTKGTVSPGRRPWMAFHLPRQITPTDGFTWRKRSVNRLVTKEGNTYGGFAAFRDEILGDICVVSNGGSTFQERERTKRFPPLTEAKTELSESTHQSVCLGPSRFRQASPREESRLFKEHQEAQM
ncbi:uncharacterized protein LOC143828551 [Paroedura picta]|uniref:uncharacterized protein LOC143828551 n=1 Tax=Paroedura picta TaxID=143630 RepID=UPI004056970F